MIIHMISGELSIPDTIGKELLKIARDSIISAVKHDKIRTVDTSDPFLKSYHGVFVTLKKEGYLRGCIGYIEPPWPLNRCIVEAAVATALQDPRFPPVRYDEMESIMIDVNVLAKPVRIDPRTKSGFDSIVIGRDGLIAELGFRRGILLPHVAIEEKFTVEEFLDATCMKAGLSAKSWKRDDCRIEKFSSQVFSEDTP